MLYQRFRRRHFKSLNDSHPSFPCKVKVIFELTPPYPFGTKEANRFSRTGWAELVDGKMRGGPLHLDAHRGTMWPESRGRQRPLEVNVEFSDIQIRLEGTKLSLRFEAETLDHLESEIARFYYDFPVFVNLDFGDSPAVDTVVIVAENGAQAVWIPAGKGPIFTTHKQRQEEFVERAIKCMQDEQLARERRFLVALEYFYAATRLQSLGEMPGEFAGEAILNFAKILEVLFPRTSEIETADSARRGLKQLGFTEEEIECHYIPAIYLRNELGVGHPKLSRLSQGDLDLVHEYAAVAEGYFRNLLRKIRDLPEGARTFLRIEDAELLPQKLDRRLRQKLQECRTARDSKPSKSVTITKPPPSVARASKY